PSAWGQHLGQSTSSLVNASTWGLMLTGRLLRGDQSPGVLATLHGLTRRLGEPVIRSAVKAAIKELGRQFVLGESIDAALRRGAAERAKGFSHSFDMLGEAALTNVDAQKFYRAYEAAIERIAAEALASDFKDNPGISIKLSALHPRYEAAQRDAVMAELVPKVRQLAWAAKMANLGLTIDAEEMDRLDLSLEVIAAVLSDPALAGWDGFGMVVQSYGKRAAQVIDWFHALAVTHDRRVTLRLVKGAYWDSEIKKAQVKGLADYPVLTFKQATDVAYLCCAERLLALTDRIYPQFATHNACTVAAILEMAGDRSDRAEAFEFQRLHGMGEALHRLTREAE
ncbi:MAG: proline dehydrogenase family protein, partial [Rhodospirillaceae bacterium]